MIMDSCIMESISKKRKLQVSRINGGEEQEEEEEEDKEIDKFYALIKRMREARDRLISASENLHHHDHHADHASKTKALHDHHDHNKIQLLRKRKIEAMGVNEEALEKQRPSTVVSAWTPTFQREDFIDHHHHHHHHHHQADQDQDQYQDQDRDRVRLCSGGFNIVPTLGLTLGLATSSSTLVNMSVAAADQTRRDGRGKATEAGLDLTLSL